jgi:hypothetical protein
MREKLLLCLLLDGIAQVVLMVLCYWIDCLRRGGARQRLVRTRPRHAARAPRGLYWTACGEVALPEPMARRWNGHDLYQNDSETMPPLSELGCDDIRSTAGCPDRDAPMCLPWPPGSRYGQLRLPKLGPESLN